MIRIEPAVQDLVHFYLTITEIKAPRCLFTFIPGVALYFQFSLIITHKAIRVTHSSSDISKISKNYSFLEEYGQDPDEIKLKPGPAGCQSRFCLSSYVFRL